MNVCRARTCAVRRIQGLREAQSIFKLAGRHIRCFANDVSFPRDLGKSYLIEPSKSHLLGPREPALVDLTVDAYFRRTVESSSADDQALVVCEGKNVLVEHTYESLNKKVEDFAKGLMKLGIKIGDRVGVWMPNNEEWVIAQLATARIGAILVSINPAYKSQELLHALNLVQVKLLIMTSKVSTSDYIKIMDELIPSLRQRSRNNNREEISCERLPHLKHIVLADFIQDHSLEKAKAEQFINFEELLEKDGSLEISTALHPDDPINIQFTSGTTGLPKGATLSSKAIINNGRYIAQCQHLTKKDRVNICVPLYHCFGMVLGNLACIGAGSTMIYPNRIFSPSKTLETVESQKCTALYGVPTMFLAELDEPDFEKYDLSTLRTGIMAGSSCPVHLMRRVVNDMNLREMTIAYGMTETSPVSFMSRTSDNEHARCETVGRIMPNTECKVVNEHGETVNIGEPGELYTKGYLVMNGYFNEPERTAEALTEDGWMKTGDIVVIDENGYCRITGRIKDVIIRGGENIFPREVEEIILQVPGVSNVQVVGVPDEKYGEQICAIIVPEGVTLKQESFDTVEFGEQIRSYIKTQVSHQKVPKYVLFRNNFDDVLTVSGKIQKFKLQKWAKEKL